MSLPKSLILASALSVLATGLAVAGPQGGAAPRGGASFPPMSAQAAAVTNVRPAGATARAAITTSTTVRGPAHTGQPNQSCGSTTAPNTPGASASAPGSAFNPDGQAGSVYAGQQPQNSRNTASVSQYDVACAHAR